jgi:SAM-dependent methyltransferase
MQPSERKQHWESVYATKAENEVSWFQTGAADSTHLIAQSFVAKTAKIVDIGGGASRLVDDLLDLGFSNLTVLDIAPAALEMAKARLGDKSSRVTWLCADITQWTPTESYDVWHDRAVFHFLTDPNDREAYKKALCAGTRSGATVIIASFAPDGPERCSGLPVQRYSPESLVRELGNGFRLVDSISQEHSTPFGTVQKFQFSRFLRE